MLRTPVALVSANLALELNSQTVQLVQPKWNGLAVPSQGQVQRIVRRFLFVVRVVVRLCSHQRIRFFLRLLLRD